MEHALMGLITALGLSSILDVHINEGRWWAFVLLEALALAILF